MALRRNATRENCCGKEGFSLEKSFSGRRPEGNLFKKLLKDVRSGRQVGEAPTSSMDLLAKYRKELWVPASMGRVREGLPTGSRTSVRQRDSQATTYSPL